MSASARYVRFSYKHRMVDVSELTFTASKKLSGAPQSMNR